MVNHGISTGALFLLVGLIYERRHTRDIDAFGGLWKVMPVYGFIALLIIMSSIGLPGLNGFVGEATIMFGTFSSQVLGWEFAASGLLGVILAAVYLLWMFRKVFMGDANQQTSGMTDMTRLEIGMLAPLVVLAVLIGLWPAPFFRTMNASIEALAVNLTQVVASR